MESDNKNGRRRLNSSAKRCKMKENAVNEFELYRCGHIMSLSSDSHCADLKPWKETWDSAHLLPAQSYSTVRHVYHYDYHVGILWPIKEGNKQKLIQSPQCLLKLDEKLRFVWVVWRSIKIMSKTLQSVVISRREDVLTSCIHSWSA